MTTTKYDGIEVFQEGDMRCAVFEDFINFQDSFSGFGKTDLEAIVALANEARAGLGVGAIPYRP